MKWTGKKCFYITVVGKTKLNKFCIDDKKTAVKLGN